MKKLIGLLLLMLLLTGCSTQIETTRVVQDVMNNSSFDLPLMHQVRTRTKLKYSILEYETEKTYMMLPKEIEDPENTDTIDYLKNNATTYYYVSPYPTLEDEGEYITKIYTTDNDASIFNYTIGDTLACEDMMEDMDNWGYDRATIYDANVCMYYQDNVYITFVIEEGIFTMLELNINVK